LNVGSSLIVAVSQKLELIAVWIPKQVTITGVKFILLTAGVYTASNYNGFGLYSQSSGTLTLVASSTTDTTLFKTSSSLITKAFTATYSAAPGLYYIGVIWSASATTTAPVFSTCSNSGFGASSVYNTFDFTNNNKTYALLTSQTTMPATVTMSSTTTNQYRTIFTLY